MHDGETSEAADAAPAGTEGEAGATGAKGGAAAIDPSWKPLTDDEFGKPYMADLRDYLGQRKAARAVIYPHSSNWFRALELTPVDAVRVVILGQDPYHGAGQAHGLSFSVPPGVRPPPSLVNLYKEIDDDLNGGEQRLGRYRGGNLEGWSRQGVLLLNSVLTVEHGQAASHQGRGWELFTDAVIGHLNERREHLVFMLWGSYAQKKGAIIDASRHLVIKSPHPSPLSARRGFFGSRPFSKANAYLEEQGFEPIDWFDVGGA